jgi:hypothetical protein
MIETIKEIARLEGKNLVDWCVDFLRERLSIRLDTEETVAQCTEEEKKNGWKEATERARSMTDDEKIKFIMKWLVTCLKEYDLDGWKRTLEKLRGRSGKIY